MTNGTIFQKFMGIVVTALLIAWATDTSADSHRGKAGGKVRPGDGLVQDARGAAAPRISRGKAANLAKSRYNSFRVMGVSRTGSDSAPMYRVKMLSPEGVVKSVFVDGNTGEVF